MVLKNMYTYMHLNPQIRSGIRKFPDLMNGPRTSSCRILSYSPYQ